MNRILRNLFRSDETPRPRPTRQASLRVEDLEGRLSPSAANFPPIVIVHDEVIISSAQAVYVGQQNAGATPPTGGTSEYTSPGRVVGDAIRIVYECTKSTDSPGCDTTGRVSTGGAAVNGALGGAMGGATT